MEVTTLQIYDTPLSLLQIEDNSHLISVCICNMAVNNVELQGLYLSFEVAILIGPVDLSKLIVSYKVENVDSPDVCALICLDSERISAINSWIFNFTDSSCSCSWYAEKSCIPKSYLANLDYKPKHRPGFRLYVQMVKFLPCGNH